MEPPQENNIESKILPIVQFEQPEPIQAGPLVQSQEWNLPDESIASYVDYDTTYDMNNTFTIPLFHFAMEAPQESEQETNEKNVAVQEQIAAGILKAWPMEGKPGQYMIGLPNQPPPGASLTEQKQPQRRVSFPTFNSVGPMPIQVVDPDALAKAKHKSLESSLVDKKISPNDKCPCGSGKKAKRCHYTNLNRA